MSPLYSLPLEGATPGGGDYLFCFLQMLSPSPQPPPLKGGGVLGPRVLKIFPRHDTSVVFQENLEKRNRFYPLPLEMAIPGGD
jgi:hypothetical protein